jgi:hypothetical protein
LRVLWYRFRATFRRRWGGDLAVVLLVGVLGGVSMAAVAGARRTQSSFPAFLAGTNPSDLRLQNVASVGAAASDADLVRAIRRLPHVERVARAAVPNGFQLGSHGRGLGYLPTVGLAGSVDDLYSDQDRAVAVEGRLADPDRVDEVVMTADAARALRVQVGDVIPMGFWTRAQQGGTFYFRAPPVAPYLRVDAKVVGLVALSDTVLADDIDRYPTPVLFTPALMRRLEACPTSCTVPGSLLGLQVDRRRNVSAVERALTRVFPPDSTPQIMLTSIIETKAQRAIRPVSIALGVFGGIAGLAMLLIAAQAIGRQLRLVGDDLDTLRALGAGPSTTVLDGLLGIAGAIVLGAVVAAVVAVGLSPLAPLGPVRPVYPSRGIALDWTVLGIGIVTTVVVLGACTAVLAVRQAPHRARPRRHAPSGGARIARAVSASGMPVPAATGVRLALDPGRGHSTVPVRSTLVATALAVVIVVATLVFGSSLNTLVSHPALYGWNWDYALHAAHNGPIPPETRAALEHEPRVATWSAVTILPLLRVDGLLVPAFTQSPRARLTPPILSGHAVDGPDQIVLGTGTLAQLHKHVGDSVTVSLGRPQNALFYIPPARHRIVGTATLPTIGFFRERNTSMNTGAWLPATDQARNAQFNYLREVLYRDLNGPSMALVRLRPGGSPGTGRAALQRIAARANANPAIAPNGWTITVLPVQRPAEIVNYRSMGDTPELLAAVLAVGAVVALGLTLTASVRRRRRELAVFKTLGFTGRQLAATVASQATVAAIIGTLVGVPLGIVLGRWLWILFARNISAVPRPTVPALAVALVAVGALVLANLVAAIPGRRAARTPSALVLHAE